MHVKQITAYIAELPLKKPFRHASHTRHSSENLFIECELEDGTTGWGEGVPRNYVTGETPQGCLDRLAATDLKIQLRDRCDGWRDVISIIDRFAPPIPDGDSRGCGSNSLRAALELSLLDAFGKSFGESAGSVAHHVDEVNNVLRSSTSVRYSTTIDGEHASKVWKSALKMRAWGFRQCKVKVGSDRYADAKRLQTIRRWIGPSVDLRIDANEAWRADEVVARLEGLANFGITCVEQPVAHEQIEALAAIKQQLTIPVMLDESLTSRTDAEWAIKLEACDLFNLRISKCGGFINCLRLAALAKQHGLGYQLGCHPGESGILSAAGRHWATAVGDIRYLEGSYDHHVLKVLPTDQDITFGYGGLAPTLNTPGLGVTMCRTRFDPLVKSKRRFDLC